MGEYTHIQLIYVIYVIQISWIHTFYALFIFMGIYNCVCVYMYIYTHAHIKMLARATMGI